MVELEINNKTLTVEEGTTIIEAADEIGIYIPRFCYHKKLSIAANCRMCLVEVEKVNKPLPACATPVTAGMKVFTQSKHALDAQRAVMEYLLINHPLDCPICDQGGECELQDLSMGYGHAYSNYQETKRSVFSEDIGPLIETEMTRCIQCTRCVRFGEEIAGLRELGVVGRGEAEEITTYVKHFLQSELSGNIIDICPVGALTSKPDRYKGRGWEYQEHPFIGSHDCVGGHTFLHSRWEEFIPQRRILRAVPRENEAINETWMTDRDRFSHLGLYHSSRVYQCRMKQNGQWHNVTWDVALTEMAKRIQTQSPDQMAALASPSATVEEFYLLQKLMRALGSPHIDHRMRYQDFSDQDLLPEFPKTEIAIADIEHLNTILLVGSNVRFEQPLISNRMYQASLEETKIMAINPMDYPFLFALSEKMIVSPQNIVSALAEVTKALADATHQTVAELAHITPSDAAKAIAHQLHTAEKAAIFIGEHALNHPQAAHIRGWVRWISRFSNAPVGVLTEGANSAGAWLAGAVPHRGPAGATIKHSGLDAKALFTTHPVSTYFLLKTEPELDSAYPEAALHALKNAKLVIAFMPFASAVMEDYADFILPITPYAESDGTFVNVEGRWQSFIAASVPQGDAKPAWKVLRVLANVLGLTEFTYKTAQEVHHELKAQVDAMSRSPAATTMQMTIPQALSAPLMRLAPWPMVRVDHLVRRADALQATLDKNVDSIGLNNATAKKFSVSDGDRVTAIQGKSRITLPLMINDRLADDTVFLPSGLEKTAGFGQAEAEIVVERA